MDITDITKDITKDNYRTKLQEIKTTDKTKLDNVIMENVVAVTYGSEGMYKSDIPDTDKLIKQALSDSSELRYKEQQIINRYNSVKKTVNEYESNIINYILKKNHNIKTYNDFIALMDKLESSILYDGIVPQESIDEFKSLKVFMIDKIASIKQKFISISTDLDNIKIKFQEYLSYYIGASKRYKIDPNYNIFPYNMYGDEAELILFICDFIYNYKLIELDTFIVEYASDYNVDKLGVGGKKSKKLPKKEILGKMRCIYKIPGDRKEYVKHKGKLITVKDYKELMKAKKPTKQTKPSKKTKKNNKYP